MPEMIYSNKHITEVLLEGECFNYKWAIVKLPKTSRLFSLGEEITVDFHGGVTYTFSKGLRQLKTVEKNERYLVGWDYTHYEVWLNLISLREVRDGQ